MQFCSSPMEKDILDDSEERDMHAGAKAKRQAGLGMACMPAVCQGNAMSVKVGGG